MTAHDLLQWWNLIFALPFGFALLLTLLQATGQLHLGHGLHFSHPHLGHHVDVAHTVGHGAHGQTSHDHSAHHEHSSGGQKGAGSRVMGSFSSLIGLGEAPFMTVLSSFFLIWGTVGLITNSVLGAVLSPVIFIGPAIVVASMGASVTTGLIARGIAKLLPSAESFGYQESSFEGSTGKAVTKITSSYGVVAVSDSFGNRVEVKCRTQGEEVLPYGAEVILLNYDEVIRQFVVCRPDQIGLELSTKNPPRQLGE